MLLSLQKTKGPTIRILTLATTFPRWANDSEPAFVFEICRELVNLGHEVTALVPQAPGACSEETLSGVRIKRFTYFYPESAQRLCYDGGALPNLKKSWTARINLPIFLFFQYWSLRKILREEKFDILHVHWLIPQGIPAVKLGCKNSLPVVTTVHAGDVFGLNHFPFRSFMRYVLKHVALCTANGQATVNATLNIYPKADVQLVPMGVDLSHFGPEKKSAEIKQKYQVDGGKIIFAAGRFAEKKGFKYLISALPLIFKELSSAVLLLGGFGLLEAELKAQVKKLNLMEKVKFLGKLNKDEMAEYLATADVMVIPSIITPGGDREGTPVTIMEAQASGTPVVACDVGGIGDLIEHEINGLLCTEKDSQVLAEQIIRILKNEKLKKQIIKNGIVSAKEHAWPEIARKFEQSFIEAVS